MAQKLSSILKYAQLADLSDLEQVRLLAIAETVANTKTSTSDQQGSAVSTSYDIGLGLSNPMGAGYASTGLSHGVRGGEAMDDCGLRYLLALENYVTLSQSLPKGVTPGKVAPADFIWAFHSDAEMGGCISPPPNKLLINLFLIPSLSWASGRGLLEVYWGWTDAASAGDQEEVY